jgi:hypothetical protein
MLSFHNSSVSRAILDLFPNIGLDRKKLNYPVKRIVFLIFLRTFKLNFLIRKLESRRVYTVSFSQIVNKINYFKKRKFEEVFDARKISR